MANESLGPPLHRYASVNKYMLGEDSTNCSFADMVQEMSKVDWKSSAAEGGQWVGRPLLLISDNEVLVIIVVGGCPLGKESEW